jgi:hypothetical protein
MSTTSTTERMSAGHKVRKVRANRADGNRSEAARQRSRARRAARREGR